MRRAQKEPKKGTKDGATSRSLEKKAALGAHQTHHNGLRIPTSESLHEPGGELERPGLGNLAHVLGAAAVSRMPLR